MFYVELTALLRTCKREKEGNKSINGSAVVVHVQLKLKRLDDVENLCIICWKDNKNPL